MKLAIILAILLILITGCSIVQDSPSVPTINNTNNIVGVQELVLNEQDLVQLGMTKGGASCLIEKYNTTEYSPLIQYNFCNYTVNNLNNTEIIIELSKYTNLNDLNGSYQYSSSHLFGAKGLINENDFGDQSRFRVSDPSDYGGEFNKPNEYYYHLYFTKEKYLIHVTSGKDKEAKEYITKIGRQILSKFG